MELSFVKVFQTELLCFGERFLTLAEENHFGKTLGYHLIGGLKRTRFERFGENETLLVFLRLLCQTFKKCHDIVFYLVFRLITAKLTKHRRTRK